ncbi:PREDICTED: bis(5'-adenosyl)-triphosphatase enpp4-like [Priapulus caudatus]|uniref:Bis(5'-adenosyl)-triphosphatase enpp4-like n=1 Tax=Priapulus caudatus TaxID=37621 RepID=A0ABM1EU96_PRICU|nr:PREDICTED: bis(5'-adenosyl)-triphosphatase enpp4-like [Priapulus caudatus]
MTHHTIARLRSWDGVRSPEFNDNAGRLHRQRHLQGRIDSGFRRTYLPHGEEDTIYEQLSKLDHITAWRKRDVPSYYHYSNNPRIADIVVMADEHWAIATNAVSLSMSRPWFPNPYKGDHGYDNRAMSMHPFFVARGPAFRKGLISEPFANVNVYPLMCEILGLAPAPNNGSIANVKHLLREELTGLIQKPGSVNPFSVSAQLLPNIISICVGVAVFSMLVLQ